jgi:hypothetical protein
VTVAFNYPTTDSLAAYLIGELTAAWNAVEAAAPEEAAIDAARARDLLDNIDALADDEVDAVLRQLESDGEPVL